MYNFHDLKNSQNKEAVTKYNTRRPADLSSSEINQHVDYWLSLITSKVKNKVDMRWFNTYESGSIFVKKLYRYEIKIGIHIDIFEDSFSLKEAAECFSLGKIMTGNTISGSRDQAGYSGDYFNAIASDSKANVKLICDNIKISLKKLGYPCKINSSTGYFSIEFWIPCDSNGFIK